MEPIIITNPGPTISIEDIVNETQMVFQHMEYKITWNVLHREMTFGELVDHLSCNIYLDGRPTIEVPLRDIL